ncbi:MAG: hypothetical protein D6683_10245 [Actinomyces sp.]|nr:MAG: hypothetical protein D6683_10245 [Actinomyces sp.]
MTLLSSARPRCLEKHAPGPLQIVSKSGSLFDGLRARAPLDEAVEDQAAGDHGVWVATVRCWFSTPSTNQLLALDEIVVDTRHDHRARWSRTTG